MKILGKLSEDEMVDAFLRAEIRSKRFRRRYLEELRNDRMAQRVVLRPNLRSKKENSYRKRLLGAVRGYGRNGGIFDGFPSDVKWKRARLTKDELLKVKYINWTTGWTNSVSKGTRLPIHAAKNLAKDQPWLLDFSDAVARGKRFPELILISTSMRGELVILEGHGRLTGMVHQLEHVPENVDVIVGFSRSIRKWGCY